MAVTDNAAGITIDATGQHNNAKLLDGLPAAAATGQAMRFDEAIRKDGTNAFTGDQSMGSHKLTNVTDPSSAQDAETKAYGDSRLNWFGPFGSVSAPATASIRFLIHGVGVAATATEGAVGSMGVMPVAGTFTAMQVRHTAGVLSTDTITYTLRIEQVDSAITCVMAANGTSASDVAHTVAFNAGDRVSIKAVQSSTQAGATININVSLAWKSAATG